MRRALFILLTLALGAGAGALLLELGVLVFAGEQPKFPRHVVGAPFGLRINQPGAVYRHKSADVNVWFRINSQGMRADRDFARPKPAGLRRIVSLGDSFTVGYEVEGEETFSSVLERELSKRGLRVEVLNAGVSGYGTAEACLYLERELFGYEPDLVLVSFYTNDLVDNTRSGLFRLEDGALVAVADSYVPAGRVADLLNTNPVFAWLSGYSNAFALLKETATQVAKRQMVQANLEQVARAESGPRPDDAGSAEAAERRLTAAIFERLWQSTRARGIPLVIHSIPIPSPPRRPPERLLDVFPRAEFDVEREGLAYLSAADVLTPQLGRELLYYERSQGHWTPLAHRLSGEALAVLVVERGLLGDAPAAIE